VIGAGQGKDSNPDIDLQPSDNELYNEGPDNQGNHQDIPLSGKAVSFITDLVAKKCLPKCIKHLQLRS